MEENDEVKLGNPRKAVTKSIEISFMTHLRVELPKTGTWRKIYDDESMVELATSAAKVYMVLQSVDDAKRIPMIMECFNFLGDFVDRNTVHTPSGCPLNKTELRSYVYYELEEFNTISHHDKNNDEVDFEDRKDLMECLLHKTAQADILSGRSI